MSSLLQNLPQGWEILPFSKCVNKISIKHKVKTKDYLKNGKYPIIDQAKDFIGGYSNDKNLLINIKKPVVVFGDHTRCFKFVDFDFIAGADGIKILSPIDKFNEKLFYYFCLSLQFEDKGYSRHYQFLEKTNIKIPPLEVQKAIVEKLENAFAHIDEAVRHLKAVQTNIPRLKSSLLHCAFSGKLTESQNQSHEVQTLKSVVGVEGEFEREEGATSHSFRKKLAQTCTFKPLHPLIKEGIPQGWEVKTLGECLEYEQPTKYIVKNTQYSDEYKIPVLTAGKSFLLGYTNDTENIFTQTPVIIFDDFTTDSKFVDFDFKVKSSAMKILHTTKIANIKFVFYFMQTIQYRSDTHKRYWISEYAKLPIPLPPIETQKQIVQILESKFAHLEKLAQFVNASLENLQRLKSSLLNQAFKGELV